MLNCRDCIKITSLPFEVHHTTALLTYTTRTPKYNFSNLFGNLTLTLRITTTKHHRQFDFNYFDNIGVSIPALATASPNIPDEFSRLAAL